MITKTQLDQIIKREAENVSVQNHPKDCARFVEHGANLLAEPLLLAIEALGRECWCIDDEVGKRVTCDPCEALERIKKLLGEK